MKHETQLTHRMLEVFAAVIVHAGVGAAARALNVAQPSVSRLLSDMERATGLKLFLKQGRSVVPTAHAISLFTQIERSFISLRDISRHAQQLKQSKMGQLAVGCMPALGNSIIPNAIAMMRETTPETTTHLHIESSLAIAQLVATMRIDIGFVAAGPYPSGVQKIDQVRGYCRCIVSPHHRLAKAKSVSLTDLVGEPFVALSTHSRIRQSVEASSPSAAAGLAIVVEANQSSSASDLVLRNVGVSVVDPFVAFEHVRRGGRSVQFIPKLPFEVDVIAHSDSRPNEAVRTFMHQVHKQVDDMPT